MGVSRQDPRGGSALGVWSDSSVRLQEVNMHYMLIMSC